MLCKPFVEKNTAQANEVPFLALVTLPSCLVEIQWQE